MQITLLELVCLWDVKPCLFIHALMHMHADFDLAQSCSFEGRAKWEEMDLTKQLRILRGRCSMSTIVFTFVSAADGCQKQQQTGSGLSCLILSRDRSGAAVSASNVNLLRKSDPAVVFKSTGLPNNDQIEINAFQASESSCRDFIINLVRPILLCKCCAKRNVEMMGSLGKPLTTFKNLKL